MKKAINTLDRLLERGGIKKDILLLVIGGVSLLLSLAEKRTGFRLFPFGAAWFAIVLCGLPIVLEATLGPAARPARMADVPVSIALIASICIGEVFAAGEVAFIMQIGAFLEKLTVSRAKSGIRKLVDLKPQGARVVTSRGQTFLPVEQVRAGDMIRVLPGETIPVDGVITAGETSGNQAVMTGESLPVDKGPGDEVSSGTRNQFGAFDMCATRAGEDSSIQRMIRLVQSADAGKAKIVGIADRWAARILVTAIIAALLTGLLSGQIIRSVTILVVFCPCALVLATPTAITAAIGNAARRGFPVREGDVLEKLAKAETVTFDKTGTLTFDRPEVTAVHAAAGYGEKEVLALTSDDIRQFPHLLALSRRMMTTIRINIAFSMALNLLAVALAAAGVLGPVPGALIHTAGSLLVTLHSLLLLTWRDKKR